MSFGQWCIKVAFVTSHKEYSMDHYCIFTCFCHYFASDISEIHLLAFGYSWVLLIKSITVLVWSDSNAFFVEESFHMTLAFVPSLSVSFNSFLAIVARVWVRVCFQGYLFTKFFIALDDSVSSSQAGKLKWFFRSKPFLLKIFWIYVKRFQTVNLYVMIYFTFC